MFDKTPKPERYISVINYYISHQVISSSQRKNELIELIKTLIPEGTPITPDSLTTFGFNLAELKSLFK